MGGDREGMQVAQLPFIACDGKCFCECITHWVMSRVGLNHAYIRLYGVYTVI